MNLKIKSIEIHKEQTERIVKTNHEDTKVTETKTIMITKFEPSGSTSESGFDFGFGPDDLDDSTGFKKRF